jgi:HlyD family secretion protein
MEVNMKKFAPLFLVILILLPGCKPASSKTSANKPQTKTPSSQTVFFMAGRIDAEQQADIVSKISGRVAEITVDVGAPVHKGQLLVRLDTRELAAQTEQARAGLRTARANLERTLSGARPEQINQAKAALESAAENYELAKNNYNRMNQLYQSEVIAKNQLEAAENQLKSAQAQYVSSQNQLEILMQGETPEAVNVVKAQLYQAKTSVKYAETQLGNGNIYAPISGVVSAKNINIGEMANTTALLLSIVNLDTLYINTYLPAGFIGKVKVGDPVVIKVTEAPSRTFKGEITVISPVIDAKGRNILAKVRLKEKDPLLRPGMFVEIGMKKSEMGNAQ